LWFIIDYTPKTVGIRHLIQYYNGGAIPVGINKNSVIAELDDQYEEMKNKYKEKYANLVCNNADALFRHKWLHMQHDTWSSRSNDGYLGVGCSYIDMSGEYKVCNLGCYPLDNIVEISTESNAINTEQCGDTNTKASAANIRSKRSMNISLECACGCGKLADTIAEMIKCKSCNMEYLFSTCYSSFTCKHGKKKQKKK